MKNITKWLDLAKLLAPIILTTVKPSLAPIASNIATGITEAEQIPGASGQDKLAHVQNIASNAATAINSAAGKTLVDTSSLQQTVQEGIDTTVAAINLIHKKSTPAETEITK